MALKIKASGVPSGSPLARLRLLSSCEERKWPTGQTEKDGYCGMSAHTVRNPAERDIECAATSFFPRRKKDAKTPPGFPRTPDGQPVFFSGKPAITFFPGTDAHRTRGPEALGDRLGAGLKKCSNPKPRGRSPFFVYRRVRASALPPAFLKRTPDRPLKGSLHRQALGPATAIVESHNGPKNQSIRGAKWPPLGTPCLLSSCEERRWPTGQTFVAVCPRFSS